MKKALFAAVAFACAWAVIEAVTFGVLSLVESTPATPAFFEQQRGLAGSASPSARRILAAMERTTGRQVLHPYLGFVLDPENPEVTGVNRLGFQRSFDEHPPFGKDWRDDSPCSPGQTTVVVVGGSVALLFAHLGTKHLIEELSEDPHWRHACIRPFALAGYKQPQQLFTLAYLLALGQRVDVVINLDGFNEVALPFSENLPLKTFFAYPRKWSLLTRSIADPSAATLRGEAAYLRRLRGERARIFSTKPFSYSALWNLVWRYQDRRLALRLAELEQAYLEKTRAERTYERNGPRQEFASLDDLFRQLSGLWERSSLAMHELCKERGIAYYHFLQPNQYVPGSKPMSARERAAALADDSPYRTAVEQGYPHLKRAGERLREAGVRFFDLTGAFQGVGDTLYTDKCCHFNESGARLLADEMAERIRGTRPHP